MFVSLRGALAYALITQVWLMVYVVSLQRIQEPTNIQVRRLNAITRKLQAGPKKIVYLQWYLLGKSTYTAILDTVALPARRTTRLRAMAFAGPTCLGVATRMRGNLRYILWTRTVSLIDFRYARATLLKP